MGLPPPMSEASLPMATPYPWLSDTGSVRITFGQEREVRIVRLAVAVGVPVHAHEILIVLKRDEPGGLVQNVRVWSS